MLNCLHLFTASLFHIELIRYKPISNYVFRTGAEFERNDAWIYSRDLQSPLMPRVKIIFKKMSWPLGRNMSQQMKGKIVQGRLHSKVARLQGH